MLQKHQKWQDGCPCHGWHSPPVWRSKGQRSRSPDSITPWPKIINMFGTSNLVNRCGMMICIIEMRGDLKAENSGWLFNHLRGAGAYCGGRNTGCTACFRTKRKHSTSIKLRWVALNLLWTIEIKICLRFC